MTAYRVYLTGVASASLLVEIDPMEVDGRDPRDLAVERAYEIGVPTLCHHCSRHMNEPGDWHVGNWTQQPEDLDENVEEVTS